jgi:hypothetical protein
MQFSESRLNAAIETARRKVAGQAAWSRRFPGESLADELLRRFRVNTPDYLAEDMLRGVLAACA